MMTVISKNHTCLLPTISVAIALKRQFDESQKDSLVPSQVASPNPST